MPYKTPSNLQHYLLQHNSRSSTPLHHHPCSGEKQKPQTPRYSAVQHSPKQSPSLSSSVFIDGRNCFKQVRLQEQEQATATGEAEHSSNWNQEGCWVWGEQGRISAR